MYKYTYRLVYTSEYIHLLSSNHVAPCSCLLASFIPYRCHMLRTPWSVHISVLTHINWYQGSAQSWSDTLWMRWCCYNMQSVGVETPVILSHDLKVWGAQAIDAKLQWLGIVTMKTNMLSCFGKTVCLGIMSRYIHACTKNSDVMIIKNKNI